MMMPSLPISNLVKLSVADFIVRSAYQMGKTPLLPIFATTLGATDILLGGIVAVSTLTGMVLKPLVGYLSDRWGRYVWLLIGTACFTVLPFCYWWIATPQQLFWMRIIHGIATAIYGPVTLAYIAQSKTQSQAKGKDTRDLAERFGWFSLARSGGYIAGPALAGWLLVSLDPRWIFTLIGLLSSLAFVPVLTLDKLPPPPQPPKTTRSTSPLSAWLWLIGALESLSYVLLYALKAFLPVYGLSAGFSTVTIGLFFSVQEFALMLLRPLAGRFADRVGYPRAIALGMLILSGCVLGITKAQAVPILMALSACSGAAQALIFSASLALIAKQVRGNRLGLNLGVVGALRNAGKVLGPVLAGLLITYIGYSGCFGVLSGALACCGLVLLVLPLILSVFPNLLRW